ncbi:fatty acyl-AMP ligase [Crocosphaera sp. XPORK-15E]|uniref:fatty acyl-AMP ligase n=1 Tax=Crocosphaera sp. XPORK-15E TaxID=3110247 RepID=UPI002B20550A|nr:fatty acyl-AMP ligase [Crocosphaera sp. XPORK-15E]MEA5536255.1 fatty acyl-AMP ligase [Crocosphaera sp. XPORK-15E]
MTQSLEKSLTTPTTLIELLRLRATKTPDGHGYTFLIDGKTETPPLTYGELDRQAKAIATLLQKYQARGERALLLYPQGLEVIAAFCGCLYAGVIAIPVPPPESGRLKRTLPRLRAIVKDANAKFALTTEGILSLVENVKDEFPEFDQMNWIDTATVDLSLAEHWQDPQVDKDELAYLQYTSGSTSTPKGVMLSHFNLMHHAHYLQRACGYDENSITHTWMPYFHDYGLVEGMMVPLYNGTPCYLMSPFSFIKRPIQWLRNITKYKVTHSQAPNFAYDLCIRRVKPKEIPQLNLSSWQAAGNAAEPINPRVMSNFVETFSPCGFKWETFAPAYGLAEYTLLVSNKPKGTHPVFACLEANALEQDKIVDADPEQEKGIRVLASCGQLVCETKVAIVHPDTLTHCATDEVGEIWVSDPSMAQGYWQRQEDTENTFGAYIKDTQEGPFLRTGDLGFLKDGELYITGRMKDLIIIRGTNHYPQDLEWTVQHLDPVFRSDYGAAFSIENDGEENLVIVQEIERRTGDLDTEKLLGDIRQEIAEEHEIQTYAIVLAKSGTVLKTASGKIQRRACRQNFLNGTMNIMAVWSENPDVISRFSVTNEE